MKNDLDNDFEALRDEFDTPIEIIECEKDYLIYVYRYAFGQFRIKICKPGNDVLPEVLRELDTYNKATLHNVCFILSASEDPLKQAATWERSYNCESPGERIRLDNVLSDRLIGTKEILDDSPLVLELGNNNG